MRSTVDMDFLHDQTKKIIFMTVLEAGNFLQKYY